MTGDRSREPFGAILAGGQSRRYGSPKALAPIGGARIIDRVVERLRSVAPDLILIANEPDLFADLALPTRPDDRDDAGVLGGIETALRWASEEGRPGVIAVACDMPFLSPPLLRRLRAEGFGDSPSADAVLPESGGRRGVEPLCAAYRIACLPAIGAALDGGDRRMIGFHQDVRVGRIPADEVARLCDPERAFMNVNTPADRDRAEAFAGEAAREEHHAG